MKNNIGEMNTNNNIGETKLGLPTDDVAEVFRTGHMFPTVNGFDTYSRATVGQMYDSFSANYDQFQELHLHKGSQLMVDYLTRYIGTDNKNLRVLDVACGTGSAGEALAELGFQQIDGLDASSNMLEIARGKGIYTNVIHSFIEECGPAVVPNAFAARFPRQEPSSEAPPRDVPTHVVPPQAVTGQSEQTVLPQAATPRYNAPTVVPTPHNAWFPRPPSFPRSPGFMRPPGFPRPPGFMGPPSFPRFPGFQRPPVPMLPRFMSPQTTGFPRPFTPMMPPRY